VIFLYAQHLYFKVTLCQFFWEKKGARGLHASCCCTWQPNLYHYSSPRAAALTVPAVILITTAAIKPFLQIRGCLHCRTILFSCTLASGNLHSNDRCHLAMVLLSVEMTPSKL